MASYLNDYFDTPLTRPQGGTIKERGEYGEEGQQAVLTPLIHSLVGIQL